MNNTKILKELSLEVNDLLTEYIQLHDKISKEGGTFSSLFKKVAQEICDNVTKGRLGVVLKAPLS